MAVSTLECPHCGSNLHFDIRSQAFPCDSCRSTFTFQQLEELVPTEKQESIWTTAQSANWQSTDTPHLVDGGAYDSDQLESQDCPRCGAQIVTEAGAAASFCMFCNNHVVVTHKLKMDEKAPHRVIPFKITREEAEQSYVKLCKRKPFLPKKFKARERLADLRGIYVPFQLYSSPCTGGISAVCTDITTWSDSNYNYTRTDTYDVHRAGTLNFENMPFDASERMDDRLMHIIEPYDMEQLTGFSMHYLSGHAVANPDTPPAHMITRYRERAAEEMESALRGSINAYSTVKIRSRNASLGDVQTEYVLLPVWMLVTHYREKPYVFAMNGQTGKKTIALPTSGRRVFQWLGLIWGTLALLGFLTMEVLMCLQSL